MKEAAAALLCDMNFPIVISKLAFRSSEHSYSFYFTIHTTLFSLGASLVAVNFDLMVPSLRLRQVGKVTVVELRACMWT